MKKYFAILVWLFLNACSDETTLVERASPQTQPKMDSVVANSIAIEENGVKASVDSFVLEECSFKEDVPDNEYLKDRLQPVRDNFKRINSIKKWQSVVKKDLWDTSEGGFAIYYTDNVGLEKVVCKEFGESGQLLTEFYLKNNKLSFVYRKTYNYNRPIYYDSLIMKENKDDQYFDFNESEIVVDKYYFEKGKLIHLINNQDCGSPFPEYLLVQEDSLLKDQFSQLLMLLKK